MLKITHEMVQNKQVVESEQFKFTAEASSLGLKPGKVPATIQTEIGNKMPFMLTKVTEMEFRYRQALGCVSLTIFND